MYSRIRIYTSKANGLGLIKYTKIRVGTLYIPYVSVRLSNNVEFCTVAYIKYILNYAIFYVIYMFMYLI